MLAVAEGLLVNGLSIFAGQVAKKLVRKYRLSLRMRRHLSERWVGKTNDEILDALQRALGNHGLLTQATNAALIDIANTKLLEHLIAIFDSNLDQTNCLSLIEYIHRSRGCTREQDSVQFANDLATCLKAVNERIIPDNGQAVSEELLSHFQSRMNENAKKADAIINTTLHKLKDKDGNWIDHADVNAESVARQIEEDKDPIINFVNALKRTMNSVDVHGASGDVVQVSLDKIYVDVPVIFIDRKRNFNPYQDLRNNIYRTQIAENWEQTLEYLNWTVLLGDPGGGKSTLSKKLCLECCNRYIGGQTRLPIYIQLRTYIAKAADDDHLSLTRYILDFVSSTLLDVDDRDLSSSILYHLRIGAVFFIADGLDEVLTSANRARVVREIAFFKKEFPLCQVLVTSRYVGYETQPLEGFSHLGVDFLNDDAIEQLYRNVSSAVLSRSDAEIDSRLPAFLADAKKKAAELIKSPLLLTLIVIIYDKKSEIPDNRASLYSFCADLLFDQWDKYRDILPDLPERYRLFDLFKHLSALLYENEEYGGRINKDDLEKEAREFFKSDYIDNREGKSATAAKHMIDHLTGRAWILHEVGENVFEFTHRTFMEFFYAKYLDTVYEDTSLLISNCIGPIIEGRRTLPTHLALQIRTKNKRAASSKVADFLTGALEDNRDSGELLEFCLDTLGYILPTANEMSKFVTVLSELAMSSKNPSAPLKLLCTQNPLRNSILQLCEPQLDKIATVDQVRHVASAFYRMDKEGTNIITNSSGFEIDLSEKVLNRLFSKQSSSPYLCKLAFDLDSKVNWGSATKFGVRLWYNTQMDPSQFSRLLHDSQMMLEDSARYIVDADSHTGKYLKLARAVYPSFFERSTQRHSRRFMRHYMTKYSEGTVDYSTDFESWREDVVAQEIYAFALVLYAETHTDFLNPEALEKIKGTVSNLSDALDSSQSSLGQWCRVWLDGGRTLFLTSDSWSYRNILFADYSG